MTVKVGLIGTGTVGGGCIDIILKHQEDFKRHFGIDIELARGCSLNSTEAEAHGVGHLFTDNFNNIINDPEIDIVVEVIGGTTIARTVVLKALEAGKNVVTANKALMATFGKEVMEAAAAANKEIMFEASVGGGIPIIDPLKHSLIANEISSVMGIVNGTTNYMLTRMADNGLSYDEALREAQDRGFAEANPSADVDGFDAAAKIAILSSIAFNSRVTLDDVYADGITHISPVDIEAARDMGYVIKLLAIAHRMKGAEGKPDSIDVRVHPTMIPVTHQLATVNGVYNAIYVVGDAVGETMFFGEGAGAGAAASAVMGDVLEVARHIQQGVKPMVGCTCTDDLAILPVQELSMRYYLRFTVADRIGVLESMAGVFCRHNISVKSIAQWGHSEVEKPGAEKVDIVVVTHTCCESDVRDAIAEVSSLENVLLGEPSVIRVED
jgi:homoserine dehydrogenase